MKKAIKKFNDHDLIAECWMMRKLLNCTDRPSKKMLKYYDACWLEAEKRFLIKKSGK